MTTYTALTVVDPLDFSAQTLQVGDTHEFVTKMNTTQSKLQAWANAITASMQSLNALGTELQESQLSDQLGIAATIVRVDTLQETIDLFQEIASVSLAELRILSDEVDVLIAAAEGVVDRTTNQEVGGVKTFVNTLINKASIVIDNPTGNPAQFLRRNGVNSLGVLGFVTYSVLRRYTAAGASASELRLHDGLIESTVEIRAPATTGNSNDLALTTKNYVDGNFLPLAGGTLTENLTIQRNNRVFLVLDSAANQDANIDFQEAGTSNFIIQTADNVATLRKRAGSGSQAEINLYATGFIRSTVEHQGVATTSSSDDLAFTTKGYVDDGLAGKLDLAGGTLSGALTVSTTGVGIPFLVKSDTTPQIMMQKTNTNVSYFGHINGRTLLRHYNTTGGTVNELNLFNDFTVFNKPLRISIAPSHGQDLTNKDYVDDGLADKLNLTGGTLSGGINITRGDGNPQIILNGLLQTNPVLRLQRDNANEGILASTSTVTYLTRVVSGGSTTLNLRNDYADISKELRGVATTASSDDLALTTKNYVDDNFVGLTGDQDIDGVKQFLDWVRITAPSPLLLMYGTGEGGPDIRFGSNGVLKSQFYYDHASDRITLIKRNNLGYGQTDWNAMSLYGDFASFARHVRMSDPIPTSAHGDTLLTKEYVEANFLEVNGGAAVLDGGSGENALAVYGGTNEGGSIRLHERRGFTGNNYVGIDGPNSMAASYTLVMPADPPSANQYLGFSYTSSGRYGLGWFDIGSGGGAGVTLDTNQTITGNKTFNGQSTFNGQISGGTNQKIQMDNDVQVRGNGAASRSVEFYDGNNSNFVELKAHNTTTESYGVVWPQAMPTSATQSLQISSIDNTNKLVYLHWA